MTNRTALLLSLAIIVVAGLVVWALLARSTATVQNNPGQSAAVIGAGLASTTPAFPAGAATDIAADYKG